MRNRTPLFFLLSLAILAADQITKQLIKTHVAPFKTIHVSPFFNIIYAENVGAAFSMFRSLGNTFFIIVALIAVIIMAVLMVRNVGHRLVFSLVLGGAAGNLVDRIRYGYVVDFLDVYVGRHHWPTFNVADSALSVGIVLLLFTTLAEYKDTK